MKQFSLEEYLKNPSRKVVTRDGRNVKIHCTDFFDGEYPIIARIEGDAFSTSFTKDGKYESDRYSEYDLFFDSEKHERWINIYWDSDSEDENDIYTGAYVYKSKEDAEKDGIDNGNYMTTVKIEWED